MIIYSVRSKSSFEHVSVIHQEILEAREGNKAFPICVLGNKNDETDWREVEFEEGQKLAARLRCAFEECSAKEGVNVEKGIFDLVREVRRWRAVETAMREARFGGEEDAKKRKEEEEQKRSSLRRRVFCW
jgi:GTPase SAR1 family protein